MQATLSMTHDEVKLAIALYIRQRLRFAIPAKDIRLQVKSTQNYRSEWEEAVTRVELERASVSALDDD